MAGIGPSGEPGQDGEMPVFEWASAARPTTQSSRRSPMVFLIGRQEKGMRYTIFTDSVSAMTRVTNGAPGPGQQAAIRIIELAQRVVARGNSIDIKWTPGRENRPEGAKEMATLPPLRATTRHYSLAFLRRRATERATTAWRKDIETRNAGRRTFRLPTAGHQTPATLSL